MISSLPNDESKFSCRKALNQITSVSFDFVIGLAGWPPKYALKEYDKSEIKLSLSKIYLRNHPYLIVEMPDVLHKPNQRLFN